VHVVAPFVDLYAGAPCCHPACHPAVPTCNSTAAPAYSTAAGDPVAQTNPDTSPQRPSTASIMAVSSRTTKSTDNPPRHNLQVASAGLARDIARPTVEELPNPSR
jgi:hypothetical protein